MSQKDIQVHAGNQSQPEWDQMSIRAGVKSLRDARRNLHNARYTIGNIMTKRGVDELYMDTMKVADQVGDLLAHAENISSRIDEAVARENAEDAAALQD